jgi:molybdate transport system substrate-binding protein
MSVFRFSLAAVLLALLPSLVLAQQLMVSAAASLTNAFKELAPTYEAAHPGVTLRLNFAASGTLLQQIEQGAPVDVLVSADQITVTRGIEKGVFDASSKRDFARNSVVLVVPSQDAEGLPTTLQALSQPNWKRIAVGKVATVPVGRYTKEALDKVGLWESLTPKFVYADTVRQALDYVARGEADAGFVYRTDAAVMADKVKVAFTVEGHTPVTYPAVMVKASSNTKQAQQFIAYLSSESAQAVLSKYGFGRP